MAVFHAIEKLIDAVIAVIPRPKPPLSSVKNAHLIAHRGAHDKKAGIVENTMAAFQRAKDLGCWGIEFDVHATNDGVLVVHHDPTLKRLWGSNLTIANCHFKALHAMAPDIPRLCDVVARFGKDLHLFVELKNPFKAENALKEALKNLTACKHYHLLSLDAALFGRLTAFPRAAMLLVPMQNNVEQFVNESINKGYGGVLGHYLLLTNAKIGQLRAADLIAGVGFVESKFSLYRELNRSIEYLFTNKAARISSLLQALSVPKGN